MTRTLTSLVERFRSARIVVVGDLILDHYLWGTVDRISPEAPVPVVMVKSESRLLGGAGNVFHNILSLGGSVGIYGVIGNDDAGRHLSHAFDACVHANRERVTLGVFTDSQRKTTEKIRIIAHNQQVVRVDSEQQGEIHKEHEQQIIGDVAAHCREADCLVISDYAKGVVTERMIPSFISITTECRIPLIVDPKVEHFSRYHGVTMITPNQKEAMQAAGMWPPATSDLAQIEYAGHLLKTRYGCQAVLITRGEHGMSLFEQDETVTHIPTTAKPVYDVTGAGDTVIGTLALALSAGASYREAATLATLAAGIVVGKVGTATASQEELIDALASKWEG